MKLVGITGTGTGKLGSSVFAVNSGTQIVRQYQPVVSNPSTQAQVEQRAKLKLASQLARDLAVSIAIPKVGLSSTRNQFIKKNFKAISYAEDTAQVDLSAVQVTNSSLYLGQMTASIDSAGKTLSIGFTNINDATFDAYEIGVYKRNTDGSLAFVKNYTIDKSTISIVGREDIEETDGFFTSNMVIFAYGVSYANGNAKATYANISVNEGRTLASLIATRRVLLGDVNVSMSQTIVPIVQA